MGDGSPLVLLLVEFDEGLERWRHRGLIFFISLVYFLSRLKQIPSKCDSPNPSIFAYMPIARGQ